MKRATLTSSPPSPTPAYGSLEDITLHPKLGVLHTESLELLKVVLGHPLAALSDLHDPVTQRTLNHAEIACDLRDRPPCLVNDPNNSLTKPPAILLPLLWHLDPQYRRLHDPGEPQIKDTYYGDLESGPRRPPDRETDRNKPRPIHS